MQYHLEACWTSRYFQVPFKHSLGGSEARDIPLVSSITEVNACQVLSPKVHTPLPVKITQILVCYDIDVLQSTLMINLPSLRWRTSSLCSSKGSNTFKYIVYPNCIQSWVRPHETFWQMTCGLHFPTLSLSNIIMSSTCFVSTVHG